MKRENDITYNIDKIPVSTKQMKNLKMDKKKPVIKLKNCRKSHQCYVFCPRDAIELQDLGNPKINTMLCDGCLICLRICPFNAIGEKDEK